MSQPTYLYVFVINCGDTNTKHMFFTEPMGVIGPILVKGLSKIQLYLKTIRPRKANPIIANPQAKTVTGGDQANVENDIF